MSEILSWTKETAAAGCIQDSETIGLIVQNVLPVTLRELGDCAGFNYKRLEACLAEDGRIYREEGDPDMVFADLIEYTSKMSDAARLFYTMNLTNILRDQNTPLKWLRLFSAISVRSFVDYLRQSCKAYRKPELINEVFEGADYFDIKITDKTTIGGFIGVAHGKVFRPWIPGGRISIGEYERNVKNGCLMIMNLFKGLGMLITQQREPQRQKNREIQEMFLDCIFLDKPLPEEFIERLRAGDNA